MKRNSKNYVSKKLQAEVTNMLRTLTIHTYL